MFKRIKNRFIRFIARGLFLLICLCVGWFAVNRLVCPLSAVRIEELASGGANGWAFAGRLRIATYNIAHGRGTAESNWQVGKMRAHRERLSRIAELLKQEKADIVVLNEVDFDTVWSGHINQAEYIAREAGFRFRIEQRNYDAAVPFVSLRSGNAILSRYPVEDARVVDFPGYSRWESILVGHKRGLLCTVVLEDDSRIRLLAVHLECRSQRLRMEAAGKIEEVRKASSLPLVVAGDMNSTLSDFPHAQLASDGTTAMSYLLDGGGYCTLPAGEPSASDLTFSSMDPRSVIDWILLPSGWAMLSKNVTGGRLSDHRAVIMEVQTGESGRQ